MTDEQFFTGSRKTLFDYWQEEFRARKFLKGGTRTPMVEYVTREDIDLLRNATWLDIGAGAGFIQSKVDPRIYRMVIALDISWEGLKVHQCRYSQRICGSFFSPPFRKGAFEVISSFFCLSDYPNLLKIVDSLVSLAEGGKFILVDYAEGDEYWETRKINHAPELIGNINLRSEEYISQEVYKFETIDLESVEVKSFRTSTKDLSSGHLELPEIITRKFIHCIFVLEKSRKNSEFFSLSLHRDY